MIKSIKKSWSSCICVIYRYILDIFISLSDMMATFWPYKAMRSTIWSGTVRAKRSDTLVKTIEKQYKVDIGRRWDMKLWNYLKEKWYDSFSDMLKKVK